MWAAVCFGMASWWYWGVQEGMPSARREQPAGVLLRMCDRIVLSFFLRRSCWCEKRTAVQLRPTHVVFWVGRERNMQSVWNLGLALCCLWQPRAVPLLEVFYLFSPHFYKPFLFFNAYVFIFIAVEIQFLVQRSVFTQGVSAEESRQEKCWKCHVPDLSSDLPNMIFIFCIFFSFFFFPMQ